MSGDDSVALFFGAGASAAFGYPVTGQIMKLIRDRLAAGSLFADRAEPTWVGGERLAVRLTAGKPHVAAFPDRVEHRSAAELMAVLKERLGILFPGLDHVGDQLPRITDVLSLIDHLLLAGDVPSPRLLPRYLEEVRELLERAVMEVLQGPADPELAARGRDRLDRLVGWVCGTGAGRKRPEPVTVISTNYDTLFEGAIYRRLEADLGPGDDGIDFGFAWRDPRTGLLRPPPTEPAVRLYKLHGSLDWLRCQLCGHAYVNKVAAIYHLAFLRWLESANTCHCLQGPLRPVIVAPSMVRSIRDANLLSVWQRSLEALRRARRWVIVGYSLPGEDLAIRSILMRAERGHDGPLDVAVFQTDPELECRYRVMFPGCRYEKGGMERLIDELP